MAASTMNPQTTDPLLDQIDVSANRAAQKYSPRELAARAAWGVGALLFRWSPRLLYGWRAWLLRRFGARIGRNVHIYPSVRVQHPWLLEIGDFAAVGAEARIYNLGKVTIGARATVSQLAHLCAGGHDPGAVDMQLLKSPIVIGADAWVCAEAFVGPGVTVGEGAVVGARAAVFKDVAAWTVVGGNPAEVLKQREIRAAQQHP